MRLIPTSLTQKLIDPNDPTSGMTLDALRARQKALLTAKPEAPAQIASPWQGAAFMANSFVNSLQQKQAEEQEAAGRQQLAQAMMQRDPVTGELTPEGQAIVARLDPELNMKFIAESMAARRAKAEREAGYAHEEAVNTRELGEAKDKLQEQRDWDQAHPKEQWVEVEPGKFQDKVTGRVEFRQAPTPEETWAPDPNDPTKLRSSRGNEKYVDKPTPADSYRPMTDEDYVKFGMTKDSNKPMTFNIAKNRPEAVSGGGVTVNTAQPMAGEVAARVALGDDYLTNYDSVKAAIDRGELTGWIDMARGGTAAGSETANRALLQLKSGVEALVRQLTGAGKTLEEARDYAERYLPTWRDDAKSMALKAEELKNNLTSTSEGAKFGRKAPPTPGSSSDQTPAPEQGSGDQYVAGQDYTDADGNTATYLGNGQWREK